jgi:hypothetical protein
MTSRREKSNSPTTNRNKSGREKRETLSTTEAMTGAWTNTSPCSPWVEEVCDSDAESTSRNKISLDGNRPSAQVKHVFQSFVLINRL